MSAAQVVFLAAFSALLVILVAVSAGIVVAAARASGHAGRRGLLRALGLSPSLPAASTRWAYYLHRLTGIGIFAFLVLHIGDVSLLAFSASLYNRVHQLYGTPAPRCCGCSSARWCWPCCSTCSTACGLSWWMWPTWTCGHPSAC